MPDVYQLESAAASPLSLVDAKAFMKVSSSADDALIQSLIDAATEWGEKYTGRDFRAKTWKLLMDTFPVRITLNRDPVATITSIKHFVLGSLVTVSAAIYYLKKLTQCSEILLVVGQDWPTDTDDQEQAIEVEFVTESYYCTNEILEALKRHVSYLYSNRGDCPGMKIAADLAMATFIYDQFRISRL